MVGYVRVTVDNDEKISPEIQAEAIPSFCDLEGLGARRDVRRARQVRRRGQEAPAARCRPQGDPLRPGVRPRGLQDRPLLALGGRLREPARRAPRARRRLRVDLGELRHVERDRPGDAPDHDGLRRARAARSSERITDWHRHRTRNGAPPPKLPLGYWRERDEDGRQIGPVLVDEPEAELVRDGIDVLLSTGSLAEVERLWASRGVAKHPTTIRQTLTSPTLAGVRRADGTRDHKGRRKVGAGVERHVRLRSRTGRP